MLRPFLESCGAGLPALGEIRPTFLLCALSAPGLFDALELIDIEDFPTIFDTRFIIGFDLAIALSSPAPSCTIFRHCLRAACRAENANVNYEFVFGVKCI